jgi:hypothetical protein
MTFLLDTAAISETRKRRPNAGFIAWLERYGTAACALSVVTLGELQSGASRHRDPAVRAALEAWLTRDVMTTFADRVLSVDAEVARLWGRIVGEGIARGQPPPPLDALIAATALVHGLTVVTRNVRDFERCGVRVENPWTA